MIRKSPKSGYFMGDYENTAAPVLKFAPYLKRGNRSGKKKTSEFLVGFFKNSYINQAEFILKGEKCRYFACPGWRAVWADRQTGNLNNGAVPGIPESHAVHEAILIEPAAPVAHIVGGYI